MATALKNFSGSPAAIPSAHDMVIGIVVAQWNSHITSKLLMGAVQTLLKAGCRADNIVVKHVPGAYELPFAAQLFADNTVVDGVIALGCVVKGDTPHFDYVCMGATQGIMNVQLSTGLPIAFGVLTVDDEQQALDRAGGKLGNKGDEAAQTIIQMVELQREMDEQTEGDDGLMNLMSNVKQDDGKLS